MTEVDTMRAGDPLHILIVDDSREDRVEAKAALLRGTARRLSFAEAELGIDAIAACEASPAPSCVLLDHRLPDMDALEVIERLRSARGSLPKVPVVILTGAEQPDVVGNSVRAGAMGFIDKEWLTPERLVRVVESAMERHALFERQERLVTTLQERGDRLRLALDAGQASTFHHDLHTGEVTWSTQLEKTLGYDPGPFPAPMRISYVTSIQTIWSRPGPPSMRPLPLVPSIASNFESFVGMAPWPGSRAKVGFAVSTGIRRTPSREWLSMSPSASWRSRYCGRVRHASVRCPRPFRRSSTPVEQMASVAG